MFVSAAIRRPHLVGAVLPSSPALAKRLAAVVPRRGAPVVVELGAGTGSVSRQIRDRLGGAGRHIAVERDGGFVDYLRANEPSLDVAHADALHLDAVLAARGVRAVDVVVGGLPWALIGRRQQRVIIDHVAEALGPHGVFTTFAYLHALPLGGARRFRRLLESTFDEVLPTRVVWRNVPPALTYVCRRPHHAG